MYAGRSSTTCAGCAVRRRRFASVGSRNRRAEPPRRRPMTEPREPYDPSSSTAAWSQPPSDQPPWDESPESEPPATVPPPTESRTTESATTESATSAPPTTVIADEPAQPGPTRTDEVEEEKH